MKQLLKRVRRRTATATPPNPIGASSESVGVPRSGEPCISHPEFPGLWVAPYLRGRLVFAGRVACAMAERKFDRVLVDLPAFMAGDWLMDRLAAFPLPTGLYIRPDDGSDRLFALTPSDAACIAAYLARQASIPIECIGDGIEFPQSAPDFPVAGRALGSERVVEEEGLEAFFESVWQSMDSVPELYPAASCGGHASSVLPLLLSRLDQARSSGERTLLVCEHRLWWLLRRAIESGRQKPPRVPQTAPASDRPALSLLEDPYQLWAAGHLDDYPGVSHRFFLAVRDGRGGSFSKARTLIELARGDATAEPGNGDGSPPWEEGGCFEDCLRHALASTRGPVLLPAHQLLESADACGGRDFTNAVARSLLAYPFPGSADLVAHPPATYLITRGRMASADVSIQVPDPLHARRYYELSPHERESFFPEAEEKVRMRWAGAVRPFITRQEARLLKERARGVRWAVKRDYRVRAAASSVVRRAAASKRAGAVCGEPIDPFTPVVFLFTADPLEHGRLETVHDSNPAQRALELHGRVPPPSSAPDMVYSIVAIVSGSEPVLSPHIERDNLDALALLYTGEETGVERYTVISGRPKACQCRVPPDHDPSLIGFSRAEMVFAWAAKYCEKFLYGVVPRGWKPSRNLLKYISSRKKKIHWVRLDVLPADTIRNLRAMHFTSTALKNHPDYENILARFVGDGK